MGENYQSTRGLSILTLPGTPRLCASSCRSQGILSSPSTTSTGSLPWCQYSELGTVLLAFSLWRCYIYSYIEIFLLQSKEGGLNYYLRLCFAGVACSPFFFWLRSRLPAEAAHRLFLVGSPEPHLQRADALRRRRVDCTSGDRTKQPS